MNEQIKITGARVHNLKNISVDIPKRSLVVITGVSGSGKSSLAFDTLYAEGQRRYVESLSAYARQFLGQMKKPDVDRIDGLSPAIAIDQKSVSKNPRSTVGTVTEIYDYLRLLFARVGTPYCPECGKPVSQQSVQQLRDQVLELKPGSKVVIMGPLVRGRKGEYGALLREVEHMGFITVVVDGTPYPIEDAMRLELDRYKQHTIQVVVDKLTIPDTTKEREEESDRIADSLETALKIGKDVVDVDVDGSLQTHSTTLACPDCHVSLPPIEPRTFSFNSPYGACEDCHGLGEKVEFDEHLIVPNPDLTIAQGAIKPWTSVSQRVSRQGWYWLVLNDLARELKFSLDDPWQDLSKEVRKAILFGSQDITGVGYRSEGFEGVIPNLKRRYQETTSDNARAELERYTRVHVCPSCKGNRLKDEVLAVKIDDHNIIDITNHTIATLVPLMDEWLKAKFFTENQFKIAKPIVSEIHARLNFLNNVGLPYLTLSRKSATLSGGEAQRIRLATQIGSGLSGVLYILDEPSIGLHQRDQEKLIKTLKHLRDLDNTVIVVEHDKQTMQESDWIIDIGPDAGVHGGTVVAQGTPAQMKKVKTYTGAMLREDGHLRKNTVKPIKSKQIVVHGASEHNLKDITVAFPLGLFVSVTGVSGSGKSTLINGTLATALHNHFYKTNLEPGKHKKITGIGKIDKTITVDQAPIGRTPRSNPATYTGVFGPIRDLFSATRQAKIRGFGPGRFSFNVKGGRCETCQGDGYKKIEMQFLADVYVTCEQCKGKRYNDDTLKVEYKNKNISEVLNMSVEEAVDFFAHIPTLKRKLDTLIDVGLGYIRLGQPATTVSGGEAQRIKLAKELSKVQTKNTFYILDEPTTGLHHEDVKKLINVLRTLVDRGNSVIVIEHNIDLIAQSDWVIDMGPEGGDGGGQVIAEGTPSDVCREKKSITGSFLKLLQR